MSSTSENGFSGRTLVLSILAGVIAGGAAVQLLAPRSRRESKTERIGGLSPDLKGRASVAGGTANDTANDEAPLNVS